MNYGIVDFLKLIGSLCVFLYGMKLMSEALQKVAGNNMRKILAAMTSNRIAGVLTGILITTIIQSSSATTVMIVSFVNAGLLTLVQSIGVIMGSNIGTTITAWLISILGFKVSMAEISLPLIGLSLPILFSAKRSRKNWGELVMGFGLLFIGLEFLKNSVPDLHQHPELFTFLQNYTDMGYGSYLLFLLIGTVLTVIIQSSSATVALTLIMCVRGLISFDIAAAMVLGENIGTTITANLAALVANTTAKRAAFAHFLFNVFGVVWVISIFPLFLQLVTRLCIEINIGNPMESTAAIPMALALFHSVFNIVNMLFLIGFSKHIAKLVTLIIPAKEGQTADEFMLKHIKIGILSTPDASLFQAQQEIALYARNTKSMFLRVTALIDYNAKDFEKEFPKITKLEDKSDEVEVKIADYLTQVAESKLTTENSQRLRAMYKIVSEIESIADSSLNIAKAFGRKFEQNVSFSESQNNKIKNMFDIVEEALDVMCTNLASEYKGVNTKKAYEMERAIDNVHTIQQQEHLSAIEEKKYDYPTGIIYMDILGDCEKLGDYIINVTEAIKEVGITDI